MMNDYYDVIIIGSGPAGLGTAFYISENSGRTVLVCEKSKISSGGLRNDCKQNYTFPVGFSTEHWTEEEAMELLKSSEKSASQVERDFGITPGMLLKWRNRYQVVKTENQVDRLEPSDLEAAQREIQRLQRELTEVAEEREILKKVVNIFSRKSR